MIRQNVVKRSTRLHTAAEVCVMLVVDWIVSSSTHSEYQEALMSQRGRACFVSVSIVSFNSLQYVERNLLLLAVLRLQIYHCVQLHRVSKKLCIFVSLRTS